MMDDRDLEKGPELQLAATQGGGAPLKPAAIVGALIVLFIAAGAWWMSRRPQAPENASPQAVAATAAPVAQPAEPAVPLPPMSEMDAFLRPLLAALSARPELARWLATDGLVRQLAMAIDQASAGGTPARDFKVLAPTAPFTAAGPAARRTIAPASYQRYDGLVETVTSIDAAAVARIYRTIQPRLNEAYQGLGHPDGNVDDAVKKALDILLDTPVAQDPVQVLATGGAWAFANPDLEALTPTQKQLVRMGPAHTEAVLTWLRALRNAL